MAVKQKTASKLLRLIWRQNDIITVFFFRPELLILILFINTEVFEKGKFFVLFFFIYSLEI